MCKVSQCPLHYNRQTLYKIVIIVDKKKEDCFQYGERFLRLSRHLIMLRCAIYERYACDTRSRKSQPIAL